MRFDAIRRSVAACLIGGLVGGCAASGETGNQEGTPATTENEGTMTLNQLTSSERQQGWRLLFDGRTTEGWRGYKRQDVPDGWQIVNEALTRVAEGGDIITVEQFGDFELTLDWMVEPGGNSGIFIRAIEGTGEIYEGAPEMQILDNAGHPDGLTDLTAAGSNYGLHPAPRDLARPAGEWNTARIRVQGNHVTQWLNGAEVVHYELRSPDWERRVADSKFAQWPEYGRAPRGHIGLQDHGDRVAFRNIKVKVLD